MSGVDIAHWKYDRHNSLYYFITNADEHIYMATAVAIRFHPIHTSVSIA